MCILIAIKFDKSRILNLKIAVKIAVIFIFFLLDFLLILENAVLLCEHTYFYIKGSASSLFLFILIA